MKRVFRFAFVGVSGLFLVALVAHLSPNVTRQRRDESMREQLVGTWVRHAVSSMGREERGVERFGEDGSWQMEIYIESDTPTIRAGGTFSVEQGMLERVLDDGGTATYYLSFDGPDTVVREVREKTRERTGIIETFTRMNAY